VAVDALGNLWVSDRANHRLQCFSPEGTFLAVAGGLGSEPGEFISPSGLTVHDGFLFVADTYNYRVQKLAIHGTTLEPVQSFGTVGPEPGQFLELQDVGVDSQGRVFTTDARNNCVQVFAPDGSFLARFDREGRTGSLSYPFGICLDAHDNFYVSEPYERDIVKFAKDGQWILTWGAASSVKAERLHRPLRMSIDAAGLLYVADYDDTQHADRIVVWRPSDAPTPVHERSWSDLKQAFR
jgi:sugar lactone lactonase YvrE